MKHIIEIMGTIIMSKMGSYIIEQCEKYNVEELNDLLERTTNENSQY